MDKELYGILDKRHLIEIMVMKVNRCHENVERLEDEANTESTVDGENLDYWNGALSSASWCLDLVRKANK